MEFPTWEIIDTEGVFEVTLSFRLDVAFFVAKNSHFKATEFFYNLIHTHLEICIYPRGNRGVSYTATGTILATNIHASWHYYSAVVVSHGSLDRAAQAYMLVSLQPRCGVA